MRKASFSAVSTGGWGAGMRPSASVRLCPPPNSLKGSGRGSAGCDVMKTVMCMLSGAVACGLDPATQQPRTECHMYIGEYPHLRCLSRSCACTRSPIAYKASRSTCHVREVDWDDDPVWRQALTCGQDRLDG